MREVTYWKIQCLDDSDAYSIRAKTKTEALENLNQMDFYEKQAYANEIEKVMVKGKTTLDLIFCALGESAETTIKTYKIK